MYCRVTSSPIDLKDLVGRVRSDSDGAIVVFCGVVRNHDAGRAVVGLTYEAYESMATEKLEEICEAVASQFDIGTIAVIHRVGELGVGEASVGIAVAAPHRDAAYGASREVIERLKVEVPIWKREHYADGGADWLRGTVPPSAET
jgi:molybdopterin synthase catalytic subunit